MNTIDDVIQKLKQEHLSAKRRQHSMQKDRDKTVRIKQFLIELLEHFQKIDQECRKNAYPRWYIHEESDSHCSPFETASNQESICLETALPFHYQSSMLMRVFQALYDDNFWWLDMDQNEFISLYQEYQDVDGNVDYQNYNKMCAYDIHAWISHMDMFENDLQTVSVNRQPLKQFINSDLICEEKPMLAFVFTISDLLKFLM